MRGHASPRCAAQMRGRVVLSTHAPCGRRAIADWMVPRTASAETEASGDEGADWTTSLLVLLGDGGQRRTDGLALFGEGAEAVALGVQLLLDETEHLAGDASPEEVRADVRRAQVEADLAHGARRVTEPRGDAVV